MELLLPSWTLHVHTEYMVFRYRQQLQGTITPVSLLHIDGAWILSDYSPNPYNTKPWKNRCIIGLGNIIRSVTVQSISMEGAQAEMYRMERPPCSPRIRRQGQPRFKCLIQPLVFLREPVFLFLRFLQRYQSDHVLPLVYSHFDNPGKLALG